MKIKPGHAVMINPTWAKVHFTEFRQIAKGANKGEIEITIPAQPERKIIVTPGQIKAYPIVTIVTEEI
jgi:hypothetical protein